MTDVSPRASKDARDLLVRHLVAKVVDGNLREVERKASKQPTELSHVLRLRR